MKKRCALFLMMFVTVMLLSVSAAATPLAEHGKLSVKNGRIVDSKGKDFQLKGVSTHGLSWFPEYVSKEAFQSLRDQWGANTVRLAMYTAEYNGYCTGSSANRTKLKKLVDTGVQAATDLGMYVIIDWHILSDNNPGTYQKESLAFFQEMAKKYKDYDNVIYEICNEPNGSTTWKQIKSYAQSVIAQIRKYDADGLIVVGTPTWSQDVDVAAKSPISGYGNIAYSFHFYAATHKSSYRNKLETAVKAGLPVLVTEFGISDASGNGSVSETEGDKWIKLLNQYQIGYVCWNLSNKNESSALLKSSTKKTSGWGVSDLSTSGKWLVNTWKGKLSSTSGSTSGNTSGSTSGTTGGNTSGSNTSSTPQKVKSVRASKKYAKAVLKKEKTWKSGKRYYTLYRLTIKNTSKKYNISDWKLVLKFKKSVKRSDSWNTKMKVSKTKVTLSPVSWNKKILRSQRATDIGFIVSSKYKKNGVKSVTFK